MFLHSMFFCCAPWWYNELASVTISHTYIPTHPTYMQMHTFTAALTHTYKHIDAHTHTHTHTHTHPFPSAKPLPITSLSSRICLIESWSTDVSVQFSLVAQSCLTLVTPWTTASQASLSITNSWSPPKPMSIESVMPSNHLILCHPLLLLPSIFASIRVFSSESVLGIRWPKYWSCSFSISPSNKYSGLISFRMDWLDLAVQGTLKSLLQHRNSKASILQLPAFFIVHRSHPYMTNGKTIASTRWTFVGKVMSLLLICCLVWS